MSRILNINFIRSLVEAKGGSLLSNTYKNVKTKLKIRCKEGHVWISSYDSLRKNSWCPFCSKKAKLNIDVAKSIAFSRGGKVLSKDYKNNKALLKWECHFGHTWCANLNDIKNGQKWCPECSSGLYERICRAYFECMFLDKFPKKRPAWLVNGCGNLMELDGYCERLGVAFEHNGLQHYQETYMNKSIALDKRKAMDALKRELCEKNGVELLEIPQLVTITLVKDLPNMIIDKYKNKVKNPDSKPDLSDIYLSEFKQYLDVAKKNNGKCLSNVYLGYNSKLLWECSEGHVWKDTPVNIKHGKRWCPVCRKNNKLNNKLNEMKKIALEKGGECLSDNYIRSDKNLKWRCKNNHEWFARPSSIKRGTWCQKCHLERLAK